jgi:hypothetical protein
MATTFGPGSNDGVFTGTTAVVLVAAPASGVKRLVKTLTVFNADTQTRIVTIRFLSSGSNRTVVYQTLQPNETFVFGGDGEVLVLDATTKSVTAILDSAPLANQPHFTAHYADYQVV